MAHRADEDTLSPNEAAQHVDQPALRDHAAHTQFAFSHPQGTDGEREAAFLYVFDPAEILALFETDGMEARGGCFGEGGVTSVFDFFPDRSSAEGYLRRALAGETLHPLSEVGGRVFETHLMPVRNRRNEVTSILCNVFEVTEDIHPAQAANGREEQLQEEMLLPTTQAQIQALLAAIPDRLFLLNHEGVLLSDTVAADPLLQGRIGGRLAQIFPPLIAKQILDAMQQARATRSVQVIEYPLQIGETVQFIETRVAATEQDEYVCLSRDVSQRKLMEQALRSYEERYHMVISHAPIILFTSDATGLITLSEGRGLQQIGVKPGQLDGLSAFEVFRDNPIIIDALHRALAGETVSKTIQLDESISEVDYIPLRDSEGQLAGLIGTAVDITRRSQAEEALRYQSLHDPLTDLANRTLLLQRMAEALPAAEQMGSNMALLMLDLDRFKEINDTFGHQRGDQLLEQVGMRLRQAAGEAATVARLGGDEFAVFLPTADEARARQGASQLGVALEEPVLIEDNPLQVEASIGIALYPTHGSDPLTLFRRADVAMYIAKRGHEGCAVYDAQYDQDSRHRLALLGDLRKAIAGQELRLYYQPKADLHTGLVQSVEALVRWQHPTYGFIPPDQFIPLAEQTGLIEPLTRWVVETAIAQCRHWLDGGITLGVAVNLSMRNLREADLPDAIVELLAQYRVSPRLLYCEITESAAMADVEHTLQVLHRLVALGLRIAIDDYGTGYASLSYLKRLPADELKIDRAFVQHLTTDQADQAIVQSTVIMAHRLGMQVVAEGVEDQATWNLLASLGCDIAQGYHLSRPTSAPDLERWLAERKETVAL